MMMVPILSTFVLTTALWSAVVLFAARRVAMHAQASPEAAQAVVHHVMMPILGRCAPKAAAVAAVQSVPEQAAA